jgi:hypothetical protein
MPCVVIISSRCDFHERFALRLLATLSERCQQEPVARTMVGVLPNCFSAYLGCMFIVALEIVGDGKF